MLLVSIYDIISCNVSIINEVFLVVQLLMLTVLFHDVANNV